MAFGFIQEAFQFGKHSDCRDGNPLRAPGKAPRSSQYFNDFHHIVVVVQRLAHTHKDSVCERIAFIHREKLGDDVGGGKIAVETLTAGHTETAAHPAS